MHPQLDVAIIGGGQAGLSISHCLMKKGITNHLVFEKNRIGHAWREERWDSFCLVTPNFQCRLPGYDYDGNDPHGFMLRDEIVAFMERYAAHFNPPIREGLGVKSVTPQSDYFVIETSEGTWHADQVVIATGAYHKAKIPAGASQIPESIFQVHSQQYRNSDQLPEGPVVVVGSAQSGCQIAEDLKLAGREVHLCLGGAPRSPRHYRGRDVVDWFEEMGHYDVPIDSYDDPDEIRHETNHYLSGRDGGKEIDLREHARDGMRLYGYLEAVDQNGFQVRTDVEEKLDLADATYVRLCKRIDEYITQQGLDAPEAPPYSPVWKPEQEATRLDFSEHEIAAIVWAIGFDADFGFVDAPVFGPKGYPNHQRGVTSQRGLFFLGLPWLHTWGSGRFAGIARDAEFLAERIHAELSERVS
ncbi:MAG: MSMEG_0569 family flavin-dependent oxidoreductase [Verrucomicrobiota bacterium]